MCGEWTEVRYRRLKAPQTSDGGHGTKDHNPRHQERSQSNPGFHSSYVEQGQPKTFAHDHNQWERHQSRHSGRYDGELRRPRNLNRRASSVDVIPDARSTLVKQPEQHRISLNQEQQRWNGELRHYVDERYHHQQPNGDFGSMNWWHNKNGGWNQIMRNEAVGVGLGSGMDQLEMGGNVKSGSELKRYVSFYFTNFPVQLSYFYLRKGFEVCGLLEDVYVPKRRNKRGEPYGFVKFSSVQNVTKLTSALNNVWFGHFRVRARVASFARNDAMAGRRGEAEINKGVGDRKEINKMKSKQGEYVGTGPDKGDIPEGLRVGDIVVKLGARKELMEKIKGQLIEGGSHPKDSTLSDVIGKEKERQALLRKYKAKSDDVSWAQNGVVATISKGEAVPVVQTRITDAGFNDLILIPMGADKVFVRCSAGGDALAVVNSAKEFFTLILSQWKRWDFNIQPYKRGAWVHNCSADKDRLDFSRVLIATSDLAIINTVVTVLVDGTQVDVKVVEEWGYALGEDTCLFEDESDEEASQTDHDEGQWDTEAERVVDIMDRSVKGDLGIPTQAEDVDETRPDLVLDHHAGREDRVLGIRGSPLVSGDQGSILICSPVVGLRSTEGVSRSMLSGPWSLDWLQDLNQGDAGVIFSVRKKPIAGARASVGLKKGGQDDRKRRKAGGKSEHRSKDRHGSHQSREVSRPVSSDAGRMAWSMKIVSWNIRGLGGMEKRQEIRKLDVNQNPSLLCIQETKLQVCDSAVCSALWGNSPYAFSYRPSVGASGGLLTLWDTSEVDVWASESYESVLWCHGRLIKSGEEFSVANVYAPCDPGAKQRLWDSLSGRIQALGRYRVCVCGDFNAVRSVEERRSVSRMRGLSDYCPLVLAENEEERGPRPSRMLKCWKDVLGYNSFVKEKWKSYQVNGWGGFMLIEKFRMIKMALKDWHKTYTQNLPSRIESLQDRFATLDVKGEEMDLSSAEVVELHEVTSDIHSLSRLNASICWQQSRSRWLKEGDANTKYFTLSSLIVGGAVYVERPGIDSLTFKRLHSAEASSLIKHFSLEEVKAAVLTTGINVTFIALIPKVESPQRLNDFRPISLVGSLYKILAKVLVNRLRLVMGSVISESQTVFVRDRKILNEILIANEVVDEARRAKKELMLFKVDFEKAYDSECVCTATASVLVNGSPTDEFPIERGLRQGDPLSPFLFLLAAEGLHVLMEAMEEHNLFTGYRVGNSAPISVSHLQFADDTLLMGTKCWVNVRALRAVLVLFETMSGLKVNFNKSMLVAVNISDSWLGEAASALGCRVAKIPSLYLGLPIGGDPMCLSFWEPVLTRLKRRLSGWKSRFLSFGGRLVLLKSVLTSLPVYALSFFKAPSSTISSIESILIKKNWGGCEDSRKISWVDWKTIFLQKEHGGLGVRKLKEFNLALLGKWCWRMLVDREGLWFRVLVARYGVERGRVCVGGTRGSSWWREVACIRDGGGEAGGGWFEGNISRQVGDESDTFFLTDPWLDGTPLCERFGRLFDLAVNKSDSVADMSQLGWGIGGDAWVWRRPLWAWEEELLGESLDGSGCGSIRCGDMPHLASSAGESHCVSGCGAVESAQHVFLSCSTFDSLWSLVSSWVGAASVTAQTLSDHFIQFSSSAGDTHVFSRWYSSASFVYAALMACMRVGCVDRAKSQVVQRLSKFFTSYVGQDQDFFL
ncbi:hypothetical protein TSUD_405300 [Trifolium subterraneum]|uniref:Reverse transcriptase domain-containing protein n=1 Tax=Trifolium subterraneum TaxID=3900 RepID=A0A2Z6P1F4_TRISU|nr:hypothetical protein TSUD_405300 [Trifolium subterraneum]